MMAESQPLELEHSDGSLHVRIGGKRVFSHTPARPAVEVGYGSPEITGSHGNFRIRPGLKWRRPLSRVEITSSTPDHAELLLSGQGGLAATVDISLRPPGGEGSAPCVNISVSREPNGESNRLWIRLPSEANEPVHGCGQQFSRFNLRGSRLPLWSGEQGVGRSFNITTLAANLHSRSGGHWHSTYFPQPSYVTASGRFVHAETDCYARFEFQRECELLEFWQADAKLVLGAADTLEGAVTAMSDLLGRQPRLPEWTHDGMWLGLQGGSDTVRAKVEKAREAGIPMSGVWVQDWVGRRVTAFGSQLFWDWRYDRKLYPDLPELTAELQADGIRFLGYLNPFLAIEGELYREASEKGYCVKAPDGSDYMIVVTTFPAAMVDLSNPEAWQWFKSVITKNVLGAGLSGWMADYGEYLPTDAVLANGDPVLFHNRYPAEWARLNYEAISEAGRIDDVAIFTRAGYTGTSRYSHSVWAGDQMVDWSRHDGLPSVLPSALSSGMVGIGVHHSDLGGFTSLYYKKRTKELFKRWAEFAAFTPVMRSHESNRPAANWQWDSDVETISYLARMARIYVELAPYRRAVLRNYYDIGLPAIRPVSLHYTQLRSARDSNVGRHASYLYGRDLLVRPVVQRGVKNVTVRLPDDEWVHLWTGTRHGGGPVRTAAVPGRPPVFYRAESEHAAVFESVAGI